MTPELASAVQAAGPTITRETAEWLITSGGSVLRVAALTGQALVMGALGGTLLRDVDGLDDLLVGAVITVRTDPNVIRDDPRSVAELILTLRECGRPEWTALLAVLEAELVAAAAESDRRLAELDRFVDDLGNTDPDDAA